VLPQAQGVDPREEVEEIGHLPKNANSHEVEVCNHVKAADPVLLDLLVLRRSTKRGMWSLLPMEFERNSMENSGEDCVRRKVAQKNLRDVDTVLDICL
jgi:hypothetical protein